MWKCQCVVQIEKMYSCSIYMCVVCMLLCTLPISHTVQSVSIPMGTRFCFVWLSTPVHLNRKEKNNYEVKVILCTLGTGAIKDLKPHSSLCAFMNKDSFLWNNIAISYKCLLCVFSVVFLNESVSTNQCFILISHNPLAYLFLKLIFVCFYHCISICIVIIISDSKH